MSDSEMEDKVARIKVRADKLFRKWVDELEAEAATEEEELAANSVVLQSYMTAGYTLYTKIKETLESMGGVIEARSTKSPGDRVLYKVYREDTGEVLEWCGSLADAERMAQAKSIELKDVRISYATVVHETSKMN